jgi:hypothetical protein
MTEFPLPTKVDRSLLATSVPGPKAAENWHYSKCRDADAFSRVAGAPNRTTSRTAPEPSLDLDQRIVVRAVGSVAIL